MTVSEVILQENNQNFHGDQTVANNPYKGVSMHKIPPAMADIIADELQKIKDLPLTYAMACIAIEAVFDPNCINGNLKGSNPQNDPLGYDMGMCQIKLRYLTPASMTLTERRAYAFDISKAVPHFVQTMVGDIAWADKILKDPPGIIKVEAYKNPYVLATMSYNFGTGHYDPKGSTGMTAKLTSDTVIGSHGQHVIDLERAFSKQLGNKSIFDDIA